MAENIQKEWAGLLTAMKLERTRLSEMAEIADLRVIRDCTFGFPAKIHTPADDIMVPLFDTNALSAILSRSGVAGVVTTEEFAEQVPPELGLAITDVPICAHHAIHKALDAIEGRLWRNFATSIEDGAIIDDDAHIPRDNFIIRRGARIGPRGTLCGRGIVGAAVIHPGAIIGSAAYEIVIVDGTQELRPQSGGVQLADKVHVLAGTVITRSAFCGSTKIGEATILDANTTISHDVSIASDVRVGGGSWIGGRVEIAERASLGPGCVIANGVKIGRDAKISLGSVVTKSVADSARVTGNFAIPHDRFIARLRSAV